jgi:glycosyltransferase involved in cell wall biosynthesis
VASVVRELEHVPARKISVIYNGFADRAGLQILKPSNINIPRVPEAAPIVGIVANLRPIKRIADLIRAFATVHKRCPDAWLVVVGADGPSMRSGSVRAELEKLAQELGIESNVVFTGRVDDAAPYIARFTVAVLCSESEGLSNAILEYMSAGRPTVCTDAGGNPELVHDGVNGFLVPVGDVHALAAKLALLLTDRALARALGAAARQKVESAYSVSRMVTEQMACYDEVLAGIPAHSGTEAQAGAGPRC